VRTYRAFAACLAGAFCLVFEQVCGLDGHVDDILVGEIEWEIWCGSVSF